MRCPACNVDNEKDNGRCEACGAPLGRKSRRRGVAMENNSVWSGPITASNLPAARAFRVACLGVVPGLGLIFGPVAALMGGWARIRGRADPDFTYQGAAAAAMALGVVVTLTNWVGLFLMIAGWPPSAG
jgi:hypothetical protein